MARYYKPRAISETFTIFIQERTSWSSVSPEGKQADTPGHIPKALRQRLDEIPRDEAEKLVALRIITPSEAASDGDVAETAGGVAPPRDVVASKIESGSMMTASILWRIAKYIGLLMVILGVVLLLNDVIRSDFVWWELVLDLILVSFGVFLFTMDPPGRRGRGGTDSAGEQ